MAKLTDLPGQAVTKLGRYLERGDAELHYLRKILQSGALKLESPKVIGPRALRRSALG